MNGKELQSKTIAMYFPKSQDRKNSTPGEQATTLGDGSFVSFCTQFKYVGSMAAPDLSDYTEIERRVSLAQGAFHSFRKTL